MKYLLCIGTLLIMSCGGSQELVLKDESLQKKIKYNESFDPLSLNDDDIIIEPEKIPQDNNTNDENITTQEGIVHQKEVPGYRVQLIATKNIESASFVEQEASERFKLNGHKTYLIFESPLYKIRIGDCLKRTEAEQLRDLAKDFGYREAFIVKTKIITSQN